MRIDFAVEYICCCNEYIQSNPLKSLIDSHYSVYLIHARVHIIVLDHLNHDTARVKSSDNMHVRTCMLQ